MFFAPLQNCYVSFFGGSAGTGEDNVVSVLGRVTSLWALLRGDGSPSVEVFSWAAMPRYSNLLEVTHCFLLFPEKPRSRCVGSEMISPPGGTFSSLVLLQWSRLSYPSNCDPKNGLLDCNRSSREAPPITCLRGVFGCRIDTFACIFWLALCLCTAGGSMLLMHGIQLSGVDLIAPEISLMTSYNWITIFSVCMLRHHTGHPYSTTL